MVYEEIIVAGVTQLDISYTFTGGPNNPDAAPCIFTLSYRTLAANPHVFYARFLQAPTDPEQFAIDLTAPDTSLFSYNRICREGLPVIRTGLGMPFILRVTSTGKTQEGVFYLQWGWRTIG